MVDVGMKTIESRPTVMIKGPMPQPSHWPTEAEADQARYGMPSTEYLEIPTYSYSYPPTSIYSVHKFMTSEDLVGATSVSWCLLV